MASAWEPSGISLDQEWLLDGSILADFGNFDSTLKGILDESIIAYDQTDYLDFHTAVNLAVNECNRTQPLL